MKIVFLSYYSGINFRGVETWVHDLANHLQTSGHSVSVYQGGPQLPGSAYNVFPLTSPDSFPVLSWDTDVLIPTNGRLQSLLSRIWSWFHKAQLVIVGHAGLGADDKFNLLCFPDCFVGLTDFQCNWARRINPFIKVVKISHGINLQKFSPDIKPLKLDLPHPVVLYTAALEPIKRHELIIQAIAKTNFSLLLVGQGSQQDHLSRLGGKLLGSRFQIRQFQPSQMPFVYRACDIFAYPTSPWESFGISLLEAMASGLPVIATDDPIRREIVGQAGLFVNPEDVFQFTAILKKAMKTDWSDKPRRQAEKFSGDQTAETYAKLFINL
jgi:glycosyltransferase involved in cell wall biosynthesis